MTTKEIELSNRRIKARDRKERLEASGLCVICGKELLLPGKRIGALCADRAKKARRIKREWAVKVGKERLEKGLCKYCGREPVVSEFKHCVTCKEKARLTQIKIRDKRVLQGLCYRCGKVPPAPDRKSLCEACARKVYIETKRLALKSKYRQQALDHYGSTCACCGESNTRFLTFDHINNNGAEHRKKDPRAKCNLAKWLIDNNFPEGFQVLCYNCNFGKQVNGSICPHKDQQ